MIRRLRCEHCHSYHNELPDCLLPYKHYEAEVVSGVIDGYVSSNDSESEDYPCEETMRRWRSWFRKNRNNLEGFLQNSAERILDLKDRMSLFHESLLVSIRNRYQNWLEICLRIVYNSGGCLAQFW